MFNSGQLSIYFLPVPRVCSILSQTTCIQFVWALYVVVVITGLFDTLPLVHIYIMCVSNTAVIMLCFFRFLMTLLKQRAILSSGRSLKLSSVSYFNKRLSWNRFYSEYLPFLPFSHTLVQGRFVPAWTAGRKARSQRIVLSGFLRWIIHSWRNAFYLKYILILKRNSNSIYFIQHCAL